MMRAIVDQMAALAKALEVAQPIVAGVMIEMCCGQNDAGLPHMHGLLDVRPSRRASTAASPGAASGVEPPAVRQASNSFAVRPATSFADAAGALEADASTEFWPVDWIVPSQLRFDRHGHPGSQETRFSLKRRRAAIRTSLHHAPHKSRDDRRESLGITCEKRVITCSSSSLGWPHSAPSATMNVSKAANPPHSPYARALTVRAPLLSIDSRGSPGCAPCRAAVRPSPVPRRALNHIDLSRLRERMPMLTWIGVPTAQKGRLREVYSWTRRTRNSCWRAALKS